MFFLRMSKIIVTNIKNILQSNINNPIFDDENINQFPDFMFLFNLKHNFKKIIKLHFLIYILYTLTILYFFLFLSFI